MFCVYLRHHLRTTTVCTKILFLANHKNYYVILNMTSPNFICESQGIGGIYCTICRLSITTVRSISCHFNKMTTFNVLYQILILMWLPQIYFWITRCCGIYCTVCRLSTITARSTSCHFDRWLPSKWFHTFCIT